MITLMTISEIGSVMKMWKQSAAEQFDGILPQDLIPSETEIQEIYETSNIYLYKSDSNLIAGYVSVVEGGYIENIFVDSNFRREKVATQLIKYVQSKYDELVLDVIVENKTGISFFTKVGFNAEGTNFNETISKEEVAFYWSN